MYVHVVVINISGIYGDDWWVMITWAKVLWGSVDEVEQASAAIEFGKEEGGVGLGLRWVDPLKAGPDGAVVATTFAENAATIAAESHGSCVRRSVGVGWWWRREYLSVRSHQVINQLSDTMWHSGFAMWWVFLVFFPFW